MASEWAIFLLGVLVGGMGFVGGKVYDPLKKFSLLMVFLAWVHGGIVQLGHLGWRSVQLGNCWGCVLY